MKRSLIFMTMFLLVAPLAALPEPTADELQANRRRLEQLRKHPELLQKLRDEAAAFRDLPKERRRQIVQVDQELRKVPAATQARLLQVLDRYAEWLDRDEATRAKIAEAPDKNARLAIIRSLREEQWINDQPKAIRDKIAALPEGDRKEFIAKEKDAERQRRLDWLIAKRFWNELEGEAKGRKTLPTKFSELPPPVQSYVRDYLQKLFFTPEESEQLKRAEGQWPQYPIKLVELADKHPAALPGPLGPKTLADLPNKVVRDLMSRAPKNIQKKDQPAMLVKLLKLREGEWPRLGTDLASAANQHGLVFEHEFLAYKLDCLSPPTQEFMKNKLKPVLTGQESLRLVDTIGKWPDYPQTIQDLANAHHLQVPWLILPRVENWDNYRLPKTAQAEAAKGE